MNPPSVSSTEKVRPGRVENGANVNAGNGDEETPLHWAAASGQPVIVRYLIQNKADVSARSKKGKTPRELASDVQTIAAF